MRRFWGSLRRLGFVVGVIVIAVTLGAAIQEGLGCQASSAASNLATTQTISPADLAATLANSKQPQPLILNVGPRLLWAQAHIPGAEYMGPSSELQGIEKLRTRVKALPHKQAIVLYCGCCPWNHCPNVLPAYKELTDLGFTRVKVLYLATNFGLDWVSKGYPTTKGN